MTTPSESASRQRLADERRRIEARLADISASGSLAPASGEGAGRELSSVDQHPADEATEVQNREQDLAELEGLRAELEEVDAAEGRLADGSYGRCAACGRTVNPERLEALPATRYCVDDAARAEQEAALRPPGLAGA